MFLIKIILIHKVKIIFKNVIIFSHLLLFKKSTWYEIINNYSLYFN